MERLTERIDDGILVKLNHGENGLRTFYQCFGGKPNADYSNCEEGYCAMEKLSSYEDAEDQGLLLRLPCKVGDTVYHIAGRRILEVENVNLFFLLLSVAEGRFGKTVFLTCDEAETKLSEMEKKHEV